MTDKITLGRCQVIEQVLRGAAIFLEGRRPLSQSLDRWNALKELRPTFSNKREDINLDISLKECTSDSRYMAVGFIIHGCSIYCKDVMLKYSIHVDGVEHNRGNGHILSEYDVQRHKFRSSVNEHFILKSKYQIYERKNLYYTFVLNIELQCYGALVAKAQFLPKKL